MVFDRVKEIIVDELGVDAEAVTIDSTLEDLGADSLDAVELIMALEEEYDLEIAEDDAKAMKSVKNIVDYIAVSYTHLRVIDSHIKNLRHKIEIDSIILTVYGVGYRFGLQK